MALTARQKVLKALYPLIMWVNRRNDRNGKLLQNVALTAPPVSFYSLSATLNNGNELLFKKLRGKKVLVVNTASDCGYSHQYAELQRLYQQAREKVEIIAFPANDFKEQERGTDEEIARYCSVNYGIEFPLAKKTVVVKGASQHPVYRWLTSQAMNGWNDTAPTWNFSKYMINEEGFLTHYFEPAVSPVGAELATAIDG